jgi:hypothetical protein
MALQSVQSSVPRSSWILPASRSIAGQARANPREWINVSGPTFAAHPAWRTAWGLIEAEAVDLLERLEDSHYRNRQVAYEPGQGYAVRFQ